MAEPSFLFLFLSLIVSFFLYLPTRQGLPSRPQFPPILFSKQVCKTQFSRRLTSHLIARWSTIYISLSPPFLFSPSFHPQSYSSSFSLSEVCVSVFALSHTKNFSFLILLLIQIYIFITIVLQIIIIRNKYRICKVFNSSYINLSYNRYITLLAYKSEIVIYFCQH